MRLLLDTHVAIWAILGDPRLPPQIQDIIDEPANEVVLSVVSLWEIAIKNVLARAGEGGVPMSAAAARTFFHGAGYFLLNVSADHAVAVENLPPIHGDPFDRLLVAQALFEPLKMVTHDAKVAAYSDAFVYF